MDHRLPPPPKMPPLALLQPVWSMKWLWWGHVVLAGLCAIVAVFQWSDAATGHHVTDRARSSIWVEAELLASDVADKSRKKGAEYLAAWDSAKDAIKTSPLGKQLEQLEVETRASQLLQHEAAVRFFLAAIWTCLAVGILQLREQAVRSALPKP